MLFTIPQLGPEEQKVLAEIDALIKKVGSSFNTTLPKKWSLTLYRQALADNIRASNTIEGYEISKDDALALVDDEEPMTPKNEAWHANLCYHRAMNYALQNARDPHFQFSSSTIKSLHFMMMEYDQTKTPGTYRPGFIGVKNEKTGELVYTGPDASIVPELMHEFIDVYKANFENDGLNIFVKAAMAHLNFVMIHPFRDGNGRMARCLQTLVLLKGGLTSQMFYTIEHYLYKNVESYYEKLAVVGQGGWHPEGDCLPWIRFCLGAHHYQAQYQLIKTQEISDLWDKLEEEIEGNHLPSRCIHALSDAAYGYKVRNKMYAKSADIDHQVAGNDLRRMAKTGFLVPDGLTKGRFYKASSKLLDIYKDCRQPIEIKNPFSSK